MNPVYFVTSKTYNQNEIISLHILNWLVPIMKIENYKSFILFSFLILLSCNNLTRRKSGHGRVCEGYIVANKIKLILWVEVQYFA